MFTWIVGSKRVDRKIVDIKRVDREIVDSGKVGKWFSGLRNDGKLVNSSIVDSGIVKNNRIVEIWITG